ncbi:response regulator [Candidatus Kaiserbacteria bacterium]|nr:response regulator [Candidatus Kaiserbacteria bacterium]
MTKVLVAEDDAMLSEVMVRTLLREGFDARAAHDGFEAMIEIRSWTPDVLLLDLIMPNKDGFAVLRDVRAGSDTKDLRVVVLSNLGGEDTIEQVKKFGVTDYITKAETTPSDIALKIKGMFREQA